MRWLEIGTCDAARRSRNEQPAQSREGLYVEYGFDQLSRTDNARSLPDRGIMPSVSGDQKPGSCGFRAFEKAIIAFVGRNRERDYRRDQGAVLPNYCERFRNFIGLDWEFGPTQDSFVFEQNRR